MYFSIKFVLLITWVVAFSLPGRLEALDNIEIYLSAYGMASQPSNKGVSFKGRGVSGETVSGDPGLGFKIGLFPHFASGYLGIELESFGNNNSIRFPIVSGLETTKGNSSLITYQSIVNLMLRYPGALFRPYVGMGGGLSNGILTNADIPGRNDKNFETGTAFGYQFLGGMHLVITKRWFVFGEYKYFSANYHWKELSLQFRSEYFLGGIGFLF
ncbi:MAG: outer membrane beta-barrel protein [Nitrospirota bacterium]|nr:outer membrane beta-barrel protein [Nitrospirota bacterium]MDH5573966.1 outer membrane beta-barrel protein [Nitrospirota bacterium]